MSEILFHYEQVQATSWAYLSSLLVIALFFKFSRAWSLRNLDLVFLILLAPGLLCIKYGLDQHGIDDNAASIEHVGYIWLFSVNGVLLVRMLLDSALVRRPLLESNMTVGGLTFLGLSMFLFLTANVITGTPTETDLETVQRAENLQELKPSEVEQVMLDTHGPGFSFLLQLPLITTQTLWPGERDESAQANQTRDQGIRLEVLTARLMAIVSQLLIVIGMVLIATRHFDSPRMGIAAAVLYLLLPYTAIWTGHVTHALPGAILVWAVLCYRRPILSGGLLGLAFGTIYYPIFLLPLWISFYWKRGLYRFLIGFAVVVVLLVATLAFTATDFSMFLARARQMFGFRLPWDIDASGAWKFWSQYYRLPILAATGGLAISLVLWPAQKNLATLLSCSAAVMLGTQFWHAHSGGLALAWYLPLMLLVFFRPNLEDRVALQVVMPRGKSKQPAEGSRQSK
ncbi:MAG: hypothetical protein WD851_06750 [Pirellulales bacterium]